MAREATITQEQLNAAADAIRAAGGKPTARALREQLGGGSMATVLRLMQTWQAGQIKPSAEEITLPPALTRALADYIAQAVAGAKASLEADLAEKTVAQTDLISESERRAETIELQAQALESAVAEAAELNGRLQTLAADLEAVRAEAAQERAGAERARTELAKAELRLEAVPRIEAELEKLQTSLQTERDARAAAERSLAAEQARAAGLADRVEDLKARLGAAEHQVTEARAVAEKAQAAQLAATEKAAKDLEAVRAAAEKAQAALVERTAKEAEALRITGAAEVSRLSAELAQLRSAYEAAAVALARAEALASNGEKGD